MGSIDHRWGTLLSKIAVVEAAGCRGIKSFGMADRAIWDKVVLGS
jgi:hypothetical protein